MQKCSLGLNRVYYQTISTMRDKFSWCRLNFLIFLWSASLAHAQLQNAYLLAVWEPGGHLRVCDTMPPISVMGDDNLTWQTEGAGIWEATAEESGESLLQVSVNERPHCSGTISQDGQYYPAMEVQDGFPKGKISGSTQAVMLRAPQNRRQNQRSISEKQTPALPLPFADRSVSAARAVALLGAGGAGGFFQQFPPRPPFPGFPYQEAKSQQGLTTAILALLFIAQGYLPFPNSPEQPLIYVGGYGESVALYQDDLLWLVQHFHLDNDNFQQQLSAWLSHTFWLGGPIADWFQYEAQQRKKQAITQMCHWLTRIKTTSDNFLTSLQVTETGEFDDFIIENKLMNSGFARSLISIFSRAREEGALIHQLPIGTKDNRDVTVGSESKPKTSSSELRSPSHLFSLSGTIGGSNNGGDGATPPTSEGYVCVLCEKSFLTPSDLKKHVNDLHPSLSGDVMPQPVEQISEEPMHNSESLTTPQEAQKKASEFRVTALSIQSQHTRLAVLLHTPITPDKEELFKVACRECSEQLQKLHFKLSDTEGCQFINTLQQKLNTEPVDRLEIQSNTKPLMELIVDNVRLHPDNEQVLIYLIEQGLSIVDVNQTPEIIIPLPLKIMRTLVNNCKPNIPSIYFLKAILNTSEKGFSTLTAELLPKINQSLYNDLITPALRTTSLKTLEVIYSHLKSQLPQRLHPMLNTAIEENYFTYKSPRNAPLTLLLTIESIAMKNKKKAKELIKAFNNQEQLTMARGCILGGLQSCSHILKESGIQLCHAECIQHPSWNFEHSFLLMAKAAGLSSDRKFIATIDAFAPFLWHMEDDKHHLPWHSLLQTQRVLGFTYQSFICLVIQQLFRHSSLSEKAFQCIKETDDYNDGHLRLWINMLFTIPPKGKASSVWHHSNNQPGTLEHTLIHTIDSYNNLTQPKDFIGFMNWLLLEGLSIIKLLPRSKDSEKHIPSALLNCRPDLWPAPVSQPETKNSTDLEDYISRTITRHNKLLEAFLRAAPSSHRNAVLHHWLINPEYEEHRAQLFDTLLHPMNTTREPYLWHLFLTLDQSYSFPDTKVSEEWTTSSLIPAPLQEATPVPKEVKQLLLSDKEVAGRTLRIKSDQGWDYLKFLSNTETPTDLFKEGQKVRLLRNHKKDLGLNSRIPEVIGFYQWDNLKEDLNQIPPEKKAKLEQKCRYEDDGKSYCLHLKTGKDEPYHLYPYDLNPETEKRLIISGLCTYAHDYGKLFNQGLLGPVLLAAYHDEETDRKHYTLTPYVCFTGEGTMSRWLDATNHPNAGPVGIRDTGDTKTPEEIGEDYFFTLRRPITLDLNDSRDKNRLVFNELARNAQGLILQYARCFRTQFNYQDKASTQNHKEAAQELLTTLFESAFPRLDKASIQQALTEHDLLGQATREVVYWCAHDAPFVEHLLNGHIPQETYPAFPPMSRVKDLSEKEREQLIPGKGFVTEEPFENLGEDNGINPLIKLNAIIVKLLALGVLSEIEPAKPDLPNKDL